MIVIERNQFGIRAFRKSNPNLTVKVGVLGDITAHVFDPKTETRRQIFSWTKAKKPHNDYTVGELIAYLEKVEVNSWMLW